MDNVAAWKVLPGNALKANMAAGNMVEYEPSAMGGMCNRAAEAPGVSRKAALRYF